ncbi:Rha family transcriptional regulator [Lederbergia citrea]|uniref:Rha family transcriptional regulator n=1 Tax=Lederbergia citrea TaxID=2833581 RepID=UPI001BC8D4E5|nr:Rha family transcriptional regulator [Lederbergia citrea]MBS4203690.1 Rha family transcriptional regulator [Lederbergia citrea]
MKMLVSESLSSDLVFVEGNKVFTDSLTIAEVFQKGHDKVLRDIRNLKCSVKFRQVNYGESSYKNRQGRVMPSFIMTFDGFAMLAMGYTGEKAMQFKEMYIEEFNRTRHMLESHNVTLISHEQKIIQNAVHKVIHTNFPLLHDTARRKYFSKIYSDLKKQFDVNSYRDIRRHDFEDALEFIRNWDSPKLEIRSRSNYVQ